ncbi:MAG: DUF349 domain-containing protein [Bacteroidales bacterium]|nr:DUF349 domain-containing protein [Bacteroidales bacterium]
MNEEINPEVINVNSDVPETNAEPQKSLSDKVESLAAEAVNYAGMSLAELSASFEALAKSADRMKRSKEADAIKSAFYKKLIKEKAEAGVAGAVVEPEDGDEENTEAPVEPVEAAPANPFEALENGFKAFYTSYKKEKAEFNKQQELVRENNLKLKEMVIEDLKALVEKQEDVNLTFPEFRKIQDRWKEIGPVPAQSFRNINDTYQLYVEKFYDMVSINRELRDLDFKKNLEAKTQFCEEAEKLAESEDVVTSFKELQKLHEQWKEFGPVAKQYRDEIWDRFKAATATINKKYQAYYEGLKGQQEENLARKTALCEKVEAFAAKEVKDSNEWNALAKEIEEIQKEWKTIGFASKKENQKIYDRFRAACDEFFSRKRNFYTSYKDSMNDNYNKKLSIVEAAEALKNSTEWKKATDQFINLQKQWKEIGTVPRKKSEALWKRFRAAADDFFAERDKNAKPENDFHANLKAKQALIAEIQAYKPKDAEADAEALAAFQEKWQSIGFVPFKEKEKVSADYKAAIKEKFPVSAERKGRAPRREAPKSEKEVLIRKYNQKEQDIANYENNIGFFSLTKNAEPLLAQMKARIEQAKVELKELEAQIRALGEMEE